MSAIKSRHFSVLLAPASGGQLHTAVVPRGELPLDKRSFCEAVETNLPAAAELVEGPYHAQSVKNPLAILRFKPGTPAWLALRWTQELAERTYRKLVPARLQNSQRRVARAAKKHERRQRRYALRSRQLTWGGSFSH